ncbi:spore coat protein U domain-containing protein [Sphingomonas aerolata]
MFVPFGRNAASGGISRSAGRNLYQVGYTRATPTDGGLGIDAGIAAASRGPASGQVTGTWRAPFIESAGRGATAQARSSAWVGASGSIVAMDGGLFVANQASDAFAVVETGVAGVGVSYENQPVGVTNRKGHLFVPNVVPYLPVRFAIDTLSLSENHAASAVEQRVAVRQGSGAVVRLNVRMTRNILAVLVDSTGATLKPGGRVQREGHPGRRHRLGRHRVSGGCRRTGVALRADVGRDGVPGDVRRLRRRRGAVTGWTGLVPVMVSLRLFFALVVLSIVTGPAFAACTTSSGALTFSPVSSYDVRGGTVPQVAGSAGLSCTGSVLTLIGGNSARATITSLNQFRLVKGADAIAYQVSADASGTTPFTQGSTVNYMSGSLLAVQGGGSSFTTPLFARLTAAPNVAAGTYSDTLTVQWDYSVCNGVNVLGVVCTGYDSGKVVVTLQVTLVVGNDCKITAPDLSFGSAALVTQFGPVTSAVQIDCTRDAVYRIGFTPGGAGTGAAWRQMASGAGRDVAVSDLSCGWRHRLERSQPAYRRKPRNGQPDPGQNLSLCRQDQSGAGHANGGKLPGYRQCGRDILIDRPLTFGGNPAIAASRITRGG